MLFPDETHAENAPETWQVVKACDRVWHLTAKDGSTLDTYSTKREAEAARVDGFAARLWEKERRWYAGEQVHPWKPYAEVRAERERRDAWLAAKAS